MYREIKALSSMKTQDLFNQQKPIQYANPIIHATMKTSIDKENASNDVSYRNELVDIELVVPNRYMHLILVS